MKIKSGYCACGKPLHYANAESEERMNAIVKQNGEMIKVTVAERTWLIPRHYIALHGLKGEDIPSLGFTEIIILEHEN